MPPFDLDPDDIEGPLGHASASADEGAHAPAMPEEVEEPSRKPAELTVALAEPQEAPPEPPEPPPDALAQPPRHRSQYVPAFLDALIPGLGHLVAGRRRRALLLVAPLVVMGAAAIWVAATTSAPRLAATLLSIEVIWGLFVAQGLLLASRLIAVGSSLLDPSFPKPGRRDLVPITLLLAFVIAPQAYAGYATEIARQAVDQIFVEPGPEPVAAPPSTRPVPDPSFLLTTPPSPSTAPSLSPTGDRITGLIIGVDAGVGRNTYLTDTMIVVSLDRITGTVSMLSIPRDMVDVPMSDGRQFRDKINSLVSYARRNQEQFPGSDGTGFDVLMDALGTLVNVPIDYYAKVDLGGFVRVVNVLGGVDVNVARAFCDPSYDEHGFTSGFAITAGRHHLDGQQALAYARVRKASGESDFTRAARQQEVISGIRDSIVGGGFLNDPIGLLQAIGQTVTTNLPRELLPDLAELASEVGRERTYRAVVNHPLVRSGFDVRGSIQIPDVPTIRALGAALFPVDGGLPATEYAVVKLGSGPAASPGPAVGSGVAECRLAPRPSPAATASPSVSPSGEASESPGEPIPSAEPSPSTDPSPPAEPSPTPEPEPSQSPEP